MTKGDRIKNMRIKKDIAQTELAKQVRITKQTLYKYENNIVTNIPSDKLEQLASVLGVTPAYLMGWETESDTSTEPDLIIPDILKGAKIAAHRGEEGFTQDEIDRIAEFAKFLLSQREGE